MSEPQILVAEHTLAGLIDLAHHGLIALEDRAKADPDSIHPDVVAGGHQTMDEARALLGQPDDVREQ